MKKLILLIVAVMSVVGLSAQRYRTTYFMPGSMGAYELNPALMPNRSNLSLPVIGGTYLSASSDIPIDQLLYDVDGDVVFFTDEAVDSQAILNSLDDENGLNFDLQSKVLGVGIRSKKAYFSFDVNIKMFGQGDFAKDYFRLLADESISSSYKFDNSNFAMTGYGEAAIGYARQITDNLTVGAKVKILAGVADLNITLDQANVALEGTNVVSHLKGNFNAAINGLKLGTISQDGGSYYDLGDLELEPDDVSGRGVAFDFGVEYNLFDLLDISAAVLDLGKITWSADSVVSGVANQSNTYGPDVDMDFEELYKFQPTQAKDYSTKLSTTILLGAQLPLLNELLSAGVLYSYQVREFNNISSLMLSGNVNPLKCLSASMSYTLTKNAYKSIGLVVDFHPAWINLYVGTDYFYTRVSEGGIPATNTAIAYLGMNVPLGKRK